MAKDKSGVAILAKQPINRRVLLALLPCVVASIYYFGWRSLAIVTWAAFIGFIAEFIFTHRRKEPVSEAVFVTTTIVALIMPPTIGWHILTIAVAFAVVFTKEIFGGYRYNIFNPAMAGRCFVYICFPVAMTAAWAPVARGPIGALDRWSTVTETDTVTTATPMAHLKAGRIVLVDRGGKTVSWHIPDEIPEGTVVRVKSLSFYKALILGNISGTVGVTSVICILIGGTYLYWTKTASRTIILSLVATYMFANQILYWLNVEPVPGALPALLGGGFLFGAFFMATDPISAPRTEPAKIFYGILIALTAIVIRNFSIFNGGLMFAILIGNMFAPILDYAVRAYKNRKKQGGTAT
jgi:Na+-transporting NADH:ubiquinone oxidoreductase subunit B